MNTSSRRPGKLLKAMAVLVLCLVAQHSIAAACTSSSLAISMPDTTYTGSADGLKPGTPINGVWSPQAGAKYFFDVTGCSGGTSAKSAFASAAAVPIAGLAYNDGKNSYPVFPTGVDGIGYVASVAEQDYNGWTVQQSPKTQLYSGSAYSWMGTYAKILLIATGRLKSGTYTIPAQTIITSNVYVAADGSGAALTAPGQITLNAARVTINASTCRMTTPSNQSIVLPAVSKGALPIAGARAGLSPFHIGLDCDADMKVYATMTDATLPTNISDTLSLASGSTASGVGVQIFRDGLSTPVPFGPDSSAAGNTNQWQVGSSAAAAAYTIPFAAAYVRTAEALQAGSVSVKATITFSYQ